jgi:hypothetical protein
MIKNEHKVKLFESIKSTGYDPADFEAKKDANELTISLKGSPMSFTVRDSQVVVDNYETSYSQFIIEPKDSTAKSDFFGFEFAKVISNFKYWLVGHVSAYIKDQQIEDPWEVLKRTTKDDFTNSETFTAKEVKLLESKLDKFPELAKALPIEPGQIELLIREVKELRKDLSTSKPKRKWYREFTGLLVEAGKFILKDPGARQKVIEFVQDLIETGKTLIH